MKKPSYFRLSIKKLRRSVTRAPLQFLAIIIITTLAATLFLGLSASYEVFNNRVQTAYKKGNMADIWTTFTYKSDEDVNEIKKIVGDKGSVESRFYTSGRINSFDNYICLSDTFPTINKPFSVSKEFSDNNYFYICDRYIKQVNVYGDGTSDKWIDKDGNMKPVEVKISASSLHSLISNKTAVNYLESLAASQGKKNILDSDFLKINITPTGTMRSPENLVCTEESSPVSLLSKSLLLSSIETTFKEVYGSNIPEPSNTEEHIVWEILTNPKDKIIKSYFMDNQVVSKLKNSKDISSIYNSIDKYFNAKGDNSNILLNVTLENNQGNIVITNDLKQSKTLSFSVPAVFFFVAILVVLTTISQVIFKERNEIGTLKALGVSNKRIIRNYLFMSLGISLVGIILGLIIGPLVLPTAMNLKFNALYYLPASSYVFPWLQTIIMSVALIATFLLVTYLAVRNEVKVTPLESMRPKPFKSVSLFKKNKSVKTLFALIDSNHFTKKKQLLNDIKAGCVLVNNKTITNPLLKINLESDIVVYKGSKINYRYNSNGVSFKLAIRNIFHSIPRSLMVVVGILGCTCLLGTGFGIDNCIDYSVNKDFSNFFGEADVILRISNSNPTSKVDELSKPGENKKIDASDYYAQLPTQVALNSHSEKSFATYVYGVNPYTQFFKFPSGDVSIRGNGVFVTNKIANELNLKIGSRISFTIFGKVYDSYVKAILENFYVHGVFVDILSLNGILMNYASNLLIKINKDRSSVEDISNIFKNVDGVISIKKNAELRENSEQVLGSLKSITLILKLFAVALAVVVIYNLALLNYKERNREIATMKVLGFSRFKTSLSIAIEVILLSVIGIGVGLVAITPLTTFLININKTAVIEILISIKPITYIISFVVTLGTVIVVNGFLGYRVKNIKMVESLKSIE